MTTTLPTRTIKPGSKIARVLQRTAESRLAPAANGARYRVIREADDLFAGYDPEAVRESPRESAGAFTGLDEDAFKAEIREERVQDSSGRSAWACPP